MGEVEIKEPEICIYIDDHMFYFDDCLEEFIQSY